MKYQLKQVFQLDTLPEQETRLTTHIRDGTDILGTIEIPLNQQMRHAIRNGQRDQLIFADFVFDFTITPKTGKFLSLK